MGLPAAACDKFENESDFFVTLTLHITVRLQPSLTAPKHRVHGLKSRPSCVLHLLRQRASAAGEPAGTMLSRARPSGVGERSSPTRHATVRCSHAPGVLRGRLPAPKLAHSSGAAAHTPPSDSSVGRARDRSHAGISMLSRSFRPRAISAAARWAHRWRQVHTTRQNTKCISRSRRRRAA